MDAKQQVPEKEDLWFTGLCEASVEYPQLQPQPFTLEIWKEAWAQLDRKLLWPTRPSLK